MQLAINFSRLLYNLKPLTAYEFRPKNSPVGDEDRKTTIGEMVDRLLDASIQSNSAQLIAPEENIVQAALRIMSTQLPDLIPATTMNQVRRAVLEAIAMGKFKVAADDQHRVEDQNLTWDDVRFAFCYQHICRILYSSLQRRYAPPTAWLEPRQLFSGPAYRRLLHIYRTKTDNPSSTPSFAEDPATASALPIDAHRDRILDHIRRHRVTISQLQVLLFCITVIAQDVHYVRPLYSMQLNNLVINELICNNSHQKK